MTNTPSRWPEKVNRYAPGHNPQAKSYADGHNEAVDACLKAHNDHVESVNKDLEFLRDECAGLREHLRKAKEYYLKEKERVRGELSIDKLITYMADYHSGNHEEATRIAEAIHRLIAEALGKGENHVSKS